MKNLLIFAISSDLPQEGKSTAAMAIQNNDFSKALYEFDLRCSYSSEILSLANALKKDVCKKFDLDEQRMFNDEQYKCDNRHYLIKHGQDERKIDKDVWVKKLSEEIDKSIDSFCLNIVSIPDLRFINELDYLISKYGKESVIHIHISVSDIIMAQRKKWGYGDKSFVDWLSLENDDSEKDFILGKTIRLLSILTIKSLIQPDYIVTNNRSKKVFEDQIIAIVKNEIVNMYKMENKF